MPAQKAKEDILTVPAAPYIRSGESIPKIMWSVVIALAPAAAFSVYLFGPHALMLIAASVCSAVIAEGVIQRVLRRRITALDGSAAVTGLLLAMNLPPQAPWWLAVLGPLFAIIIVKQLFGGLGSNIFNPALAARAFLAALWPGRLAADWHHQGDVTALSWVLKAWSGTPPASFDALTQATPLYLLKEGPRIMADNNIAVSRLYEKVLSPAMLKSQFLWNIGGCIGETSALLLLAGAAFLFIRKIITWHIPVTFAGTVALSAAAYYFNRGFTDPHLMAAIHVLSGGLVLGAFFMATDTTTSPVSARGMIIFGIGCGIITFLIRIWGGYPEGVCYAILVMNALVPLIERLTKPKIFGAVKTVN
jgi:electron transport complex protein RnfD